MLPPSSQVCHYALHSFKPCIPRLILSAWNYVLRVKMFLAYFLYTCWIFSVSMCMSSSSYPKPIFCCSRLFLKTPQLVFEKSYTFFLPFHSLLFLTHNVNMYTHLTLCLTFHGRSMLLCPLVVSKVGPSLLSVTMMKWFSFAHVSMFSTRTSLPSCL